MNNRIKRIQNKIDGLLKERQELEKKEWLIKNKDKLKKAKKYIGKILATTREDGFVHIYYIKDVIIKEDPEMGITDFAFLYRELYHYKGHFSLDDTNGSGTWSDEMLDGKYKQISKKQFKYYVKKCQDYLNNFALDKLNGRNKE